MPYLQNSTEGHNQTLHALYSNQSKVTKSLKATQHPGAGLDISMQVLSNYKIAQLSGNNIVL